MVVRMEEMNQTTTVAEAVVATNLMMVTKRDDAAAAGDAALDKMLSDPRELSNTLMAAVRVEAGLSLRQLGMVIHSLKHPGFNPALFFSSARAVSNRILSARDAFGGSSVATYTRISVPCDDLELSRGRIH
jgi:hypothetical protein